jgi:uncharacterized membrane protein YfcA
MSPLARIPVLAPSALRDKAAGILGATPFRSPAILAGTCGVMFLAEAIYVLFGFGAGLIAVGCLAMILEQVTDVVVMLLLVNLPAEAWVVARSRRDVSWRGVLLVCVGIAVGVPLGTLALSYGEPRLILPLLGGVLILAGLAFLLMPERAGVRWPSWVAPLAGTVSGVLAGLFGTGGPPLILYYRLAGLEKAAFRGNLMAIFLMVTLIRLPTYGVGGLITAERALGAALVLPAVLLGALVGNRVHLRVREITFQRMVAVALMLIGILLLPRG